MRKLTLVIAAIVSLVAASVAVAHGIEGAKTAKTVAATFTATAGTVSTKTCTTSDNKAIVITNGSYTGTATGDATLTGALTLRARSVVNTTDNVGTVDGAFKIDTTGDGATRGAFSGVVDHGTLAGLAFGRVGHGVSLLGNVSATFAAATGFTNGKIGGGTAGGSAVESGPASCNAEGTTHERSSARGTISAISSSSITVAGLTCALPADKQADINAHYKQNDTAEIQCALQNGTNTLTAIGGAGKNGKDGGGGGDHRHHR
jgi:hypothetical protein